MFGRHWIHIEFQFNKKHGSLLRGYLTKKQEKIFLKTLAEIVSSIQPFIQRKFFLYESNPHCFLALELESEFYTNAIKRKIKMFKFPKFIVDISINWYTNDQNNGESFLNILNAFTDFFLFKHDNKITHIIHCCMEFMMKDRKKECEFYQKMAILYQPFTDKKGKREYKYKTITPKMRKELKRYINKLDLRIKR